MNRVKIEKCTWKECPEISNVMCSGCQVACYCSKECQVKDWKDEVNPHKTSCKVLKQQKASAESSPSSSGALSAADTTKIAIATRYRKLGNLYYERGNGNPLTSAKMLLADRDKASVLYQKAHSILMKSLGPNHSDTKAAMQEAMACQMSRPPLAEAVRASGEEVRSAPNRMEGLEAYEGMAPSELFIFLATDAKKLPEPKREKLSDAAQEADLARLISQIDLEEAVHAAKEEKTKAAIAAKAA